MNPLKMLLLVVVSAGLACSAFAIERTRDSDTPSPAVKSPAGANGGSLISTATAAVIEPGLPAEANYQLGSAAAIQRAAADGNRTSASAAANTGRATAPGTEMPEPAEWMQLLCGLVVAGFIARRRTSLLAD
jgi:hypothetical protein